MLQFVNQILPRFDRYSANECVVKIKTWLDFQKCVAVQQGLETRPIFIFVIQIGQNKLGLGINVNVLGPNWPLHIVPCNPMIIKWMHTINTFQLSSSEKSLTWILLTVILASFNLCTAGGKCLVTDLWRAFKNAMELNTLAAVSEFPSITYEVNVTQLMIFCEAKSMAILSARKNCDFLIFDISSLRGRKNFHGKTLTCTL